MYKTRENYIYKWLLFLFWPFGVFLHSLKNIFDKKNQYFILAFSFLYGYSVFLFSGDILRYEQSFYEMINVNWNEYYYLITNRFLSSEVITQSGPYLATQPDYFALSLQFFVSRLTDNPRWFWAVVSLIYTFLTLHFFNIIYKETNWVKNSYSQRIFFIGLILIVPFFVGVTGVRFWPALFLFMAYAIKFSHKKKIRYLIIAASSILIHFSFILPVLLLIISFFLPKSRFLYKIIAVLSLILMSTNSTSASLSFIANFSSNMEESALTERTESYTDTEGLEHRYKKVSDSNWYVRYSANFVLYFFIFLGVIDVFGLFKFKENEFLYNTFPLFFIFLVLTMLTKDLGSISRFKYILYLLVLSRYSILIGLQPFDFRLKGISYLFLPILILFVIVSFRSGFYTVDPLLLVNNSILTFFIHSDISLSQLLIGH